MSKIMALLSGKGGSGKTTLALSMASMLSECGIRVLLVDCDLSTNGATYFYENKLNEYNGNITSFYKVINNLNTEDEQNININKYMDFIPSIVEITKKNTETYSYDMNDDCLIRNFKEKCGKKYDVIIFDCQAGYTDILKLVLPIVDLNLVVMETDAISSAALRSLYLKIGDILYDKKIYQVFNKASEEEYKTYSKISGGTVFTNIETVIFDWKIRRAFSVVEIPDMQNTSTQYGIQIYNICKVLFKEEKIQTKLIGYATVIEINKSIEEEREFEEKLNSLLNEQSMSKSKMTRMFSTTLLFLLSTMLCILFYYMIERKVLMNSYNTNFIGTLTLVSAMVLLAGAFVGMLDILKERKNRDEQKYVYRRKLNKIHENREMLEQKYKDLKKEDE